MAPARLSLVWFDELAQVFFELVGTNSKCCGNHGTIRKLPESWLGQHLLVQSELSYMRRVMYSKTKRHRPDELMKVMKVGSSEIPEIVLGSPAQPSLKGNQSDETGNKQIELTKPEKRWVGPDAELHFADREKTLQAILERHNARVVSTDVGDQKISRLMPLPEALPLLDYDSKISSMLANFDIDLPEHLRRSNPIK